MHRFLVFTVLAVLLVAGPAGARGLGLGVILGEPTGLSLKIWTAEDRAVDAAVGWSLDSNGWFYFHSDYLFHSSTLKKEIEGGLPYYYGFGARALIKDGDDSRFGVRFPLGLNYFLGDERFDIFVEIAPLLDLVPETKVRISGGIGARFYF